MESRRTCPDLLAQAENLRATLAGEANDLAQVKRRFGDRMTLFDSLDPVILAFIEGVEEAGAW